jgi:hypothetical protein
MKYGIILIKKREDRTKNKNDGLDSNELDLVGIDINTVYTKFLVE